MSPLAVRAASRAVQRRNVSTIRTLARAFEPHPFQRLPAHGGIQRPDYAKMVKRTATSLAIYIPGFAVILGWPAIEYQLLNGRI